MSEAAQTPLLVDKQATHWVLTLNRPDKRNALSGDLIEALLSAVQQAKAQQVPLLVLQGAGGGVEVRAVDEDRQPVGGMKHGRSRRKR